jgi:hypothetical protein
MAGSLGTLVVVLEANVARFASDMARAAQQTEQAMGKINGALNFAKDGLAALGVGVSVGAFAALVKGSIDAADNLRDMSQKTGVAVEALNGLGFAAGQAGGDLESVVAAAGKVNKSVAEVAGGNKDMAEAYDKLGINVRDASGNLKSADVIIAEVADKFKNYADGPEKTAIALRIFGKAGADMIPLLNDGGDALRENIAYAKQYSGVTTELANAADNFNDSMGKLTIQQKRFGNEIAEAVLPILQLVADEMLGAAEQSNKFSLAGEAVRTTLEALVVTGSEVAFTFKAIGNTIGAVLALDDAMIHGNLEQMRKIRDLVKEDEEKARKDHDAFIAHVLDRTPKVASQPAGPEGANKPKPRAPTLRAKGDDPTKALLEGQLKAMEAAYAQERDTAAFHDQVMQEMRNQDLIDVQTYAQYKIEAIGRARDAAVRAYDAEISALQKARAAASKDSDKAAITNQINEKAALRDKARTDATHALALQTLGMSAAQSELNKAMQDWNREQDQAESQMKFNNDLYGKSALEVAKLTEARRLELDIEEKIRQAKEKGTITEASIAQYRKDAADHAKKANDFATQGIGNQLVDSLRTPQEKENLEHANRLKDLQAFRDKELANAVEGDLAIEREKQRHLAAMAEMESANQLQSLSMAGQSADRLYQLLQQSGREQSALAKAAFLASKAIAVAEIILNTEVAAAKAGAQLGIFGIPMATMIRVTGYASAGMVAGMAIAGQREKGGAVWDGGAFLVGEKGPEIFQPPSHGTIIPNNQLGGGAGDIKFTIVNNTRSPIGNVTEQRISATERALIIEEAVAATASTLADPNSKTSRAMGRNFSVSRSR